MRKRLQMDLLLSSVLGDKDPSSTLEDKALHSVRIPTSILNIISDYVDGQIISNFLMKNWEKMSWESLCSNSSIPLEFLTGEGRCIHIKAACKNTNIPPSFFEEYIDSVDWRLLCLNPGIPMEFFEKHLKKLHWASLASNHSLTPDFLHRYRMYFQSFDLYSNPYTPLSEIRSIKYNESGHHWSRNVHITVEELRERHEASLSTESYRVSQKIDWVSLCSNPNSKLMPFILEHEDYIEWRPISGNPYVPIELLERNVDKIDWLNLSRNEGIPVEFFAKHKDKLVWSMISSNRNVPLEFLMDPEMKDQISWERIFGHSPFITAEFIDTYKEHISWEYLSLNEVFFYNVARDELNSLLLEIL